MLLGRRWKQHGGVSDKQVERPGTSPKELRSAKSFPASLLFSSSRRSRNDDKGTQQPQRRTRSHSWADEKQGSGILAEVIEFEVEANNRLLKTGLLQKAE